MKTQERLSKIIVIVNIVFILIYVVFYFYSKYFLSDSSEDVNLIYGIRCNIFPYLVPIRLVIILIFLGCLFIKSFKIKVLGLTTSIICLLLYTILSEVFYPW
jgi:hypothetical protein